MFCADLASITAMTVIVQVVCLCVPTVCSHVARLECVVVCNVLELETEGWPSDIDRYLQLLDDSSLLWKHADDSSSCSSSYITELDNCTLSSRSVAYQPCRHVAVI